MILSLWQSIGLLCPWQKISSFMFMLCCWELESYLLSINMLLFDTTHKFLFKSCCLMKPPPSSHSFTLR